MVDCEIESGTIVADGPDGIRVLDTEAGEGGIAVLVSACDVTNETDRKPPDIDDAAVWVLDNVSPDDVVDTSWPEVELPSPLDPGPDETTVIDKELAVEL